MKAYPSIEYFNKGKYGEQCYGFDKLDGSNIRTEWNRKLSKKSQFTNGFKKFGTRKQMIDGNHPHFGEACHLIMEKYSNDLDKMYRESKYFRGIDTITSFFEYLGPNSFSGKHEKTDVMDVILFDSILYKKGFMAPKDFLAEYDSIHIPRLIYSGLYTEEIITDVRRNKFGLIEGAVFKGVRKTKGQDIVWMTKVKTDDWLTKIKQKLGQEGLQKELNGDLSLLL